jgi:hypothetical protein
MKLSNNFTLVEYLHSATADKYGFTEQYNPPALVISNIRRVNEYLERMRAEMNRPLRITSGYRCERVNRKVGGVGNSMHLTGEAIDIAYNSIPDALMLVDAGISAGFTRIGLGGGFIHFDLKPTKTVWIYGRKTPKELSQQLENIRKKL